MARKRNAYRKPISNSDRVRMHRQRKHLKKERQQRLNEELNESNIEHNYSSSTNNDQNDSSALNESGSLKFKLRDWANTYRIQKRAIDDLLAILKSNGIDSLPKNHRTLLQTPVNIEIQELAGGEFWYNGLEKCLVNIFFGLDHDITINLNFNVDGLPLYNSSKIAFWPILCSIHGKHTHTLQ